MKPKSSYEPRGAAQELFYRKDPEVLLDGPAGTGKSLAVLSKLFLLALMFPRMRGLLVRKTRASLTDTGLVTFEDKVVPPRHPILTNVQRKLRSQYRFPNGSEIVVGGLDNPAKIMSSDYDLVVALEATELSENDWESLTTRLRNGAMPYQQIIADCNPGPPSHWLNRRCDSGRTVRLRSRHEDNPMLFDPVAGKLTPRGEDYIAKLDNLTGVRKQRLRYGVWAAAEGMIYQDEWNPDIHVGTLAEFTGGRLTELPRSWPRYWTIDFGFTNPFSWQAYAQDPDGRLIRYHEIYHTKRTVDDHCERILKTTAGEPDPVAIICDHDAEGRATIEQKLGIKTIGAYKVRVRRENIDKVKERLKLDGTGKPRLFFLKNSLVELDQTLIDAKAPTCFEEEVESYLWNEAKDEPIKKYDHAQDGLLYLVGYLDRSFSAVIAASPSYSEDQPVRGIDRVMEILNAPDRILHQHGC